MMIPIAASSPVLAIAIAALARGGGGHIPPPTPSAIIDKLFSEFYKLPEGFRFFVSGNTGNIVFYTFDRLLYSGLCQLKDLPGIVEEYKHAVTFFLAYLIQVVSQHWLNAFFVYGLESISTKEKYLRTLVGCYRVYAVSLVGTTVVNTTLVKYGMDRTLSFCLTLSCFACLNYFILKMLIEKSEASVSINDNITVANAINKVRGGDGIQTPWIHPGSLHEFVLRTGQPVQVA